jgi:hypothetical protein
LPIGAETGVQDIPHKNGVRDWQINFGAIALGLSLGSVPFVVAFLSGGFTDQALQRVAVACAAVAAWVLAMVIVREFFGIRGALKGTIRASWKRESGFSISSRDAGALGVLLAAAFWGLLAVYLRFRPN